MSENEDRSPRGRTATDPVEQALIRALKEAPDVTLSEEAYAGAVSMVKAEYFRRAAEGRKRRARNRVWKMVMAAAALVIIGVCIGWFIALQPGLKPAEPENSDLRAMRVTARLLDEVAPLLVMLSNTREPGNMPVSPDAAITGDLAFQTRYLRGLSRDIPAGRETRALLQELELLLTEMMNRDLQDPGQLEAIQEVIRSRDLLFKVKFLSSRLKGEKTPGGRGGEL